MTDGSEIAAGTPATPAEKPHKLQQNQQLTFVVALLSRCFSRNR